MPYVNIKITKEGGPKNSGPTNKQKTELISGVTSLLERVLNKDPATTFVIIDEIELENWGIKGLPVTEFRNQSS